MAAFGFRKTETISFRDFMSGDYKQENKKATTKFKAAAAGSLIPLAFAPKAFAAEPVSQCSEIISVASQPIPAGFITDGMQKGAHEVGKAVGGEMLAAIGTLFDPLISILISISFPVASAMILWKIFMSYFRDSGDTWEGVGKIAMTHLLIQMSPIFFKILKQLSSIAIGA
ncbi:hypothetical protein ACFFJY_08155 [Fictibacillus aquaticus]|uniref:Uncharacterized protein n=1 Tax=Fictibacillus aquaticus TaxID=2021314 RepID=A0A235F9X4_9BACL|nr:hypothetical protein [Fictibacillus aquaticus]OYD57854.1 hypothetical protein CGZ90_08100 [Fictibacillus aquaticus]